MAYYRMAKCNICWGSGVKEANNPLHLNCNPLSTCFHTEWAPADIITLNVRGLRTLAKSSAVWKVMVGLVVRKLLKMSVKT